MANVLEVLGEKRNQWFLLVVLLPQRVQFNCMVPLVINLFRVNNGNTRTSR